MLSAGRAPVTANITDMSRPLSGQSTTKGHRVRGVLASIVMLLLGISVTIPVHAQGVSGTRSATWPLENRLTSHVPRPEPISARERKEACVRAPRAERDRPDERSGPQVHVVYLISRKGKDRALDTNGTLDCSVRAWNDWFVEQTRELGWRIDTVSVNDGSRQVDVTDVSFIRSDLKASELISVTVDEELQRHGFSDPNKRYLTYVASNGAGACGEAAYPIDAGNGPVDGRYATVYLNAPRGCHARDFGIPGKARWVEGIALQELMHADGLVALGAPHQCVLDLSLGVGHICTGPLGVATSEETAGLDPERFDVMFPFVLRLSRTES